MYYVSVYVSIYVGVYVYMYLEIYMYCTCMLSMQIKLFITQTAHTAHTYRTAVHVKFAQMKLFRV